MEKFKQYMEIILDGEDLSFDQAGNLLDMIFDGKVHELQTAAFLAAMRTKGTTAAEIAGLAKSLRNHAVSVKPKVDYLIDTCGTGGAKVKTFNISTASGLVAAGAGAHIAKHGNRSITSKCGSADVLAELGVKIDASCELIEKCMEEANIGFMFAPMFHPAMKFVQPVRKALDFRTVFNILGPLANPAGADAQVMGVADEALMDKIAEALQIIGLNKVMVVHSNGLDEISTMGPTKIVELGPDGIKRYTIKPEDFGIDRTEINQLKGDDAAVNAKIILDILKGKDTGAKRDIVVLNAAAAIILAGKAEDFSSAVELGQNSIDSGSAFKCLEKMIQISNS